MLYANCTRTRNVEQAGLALDASSSTSAHLLQMGQFADDPDTCAPNRPRCVAASEAVRISCQA